MTEFEVKFQQRFVPLIMVEDKTAFVAEEKLGVIGDTFTLSGVHFTLTKVAWMYHSEIAKKYHQELSFKTTDNYRVWYRENVDDFDGKKRKWLHVFKRVGE